MYSDMTVDRSPWAYVWYWPCSMFSFRQRITIARISGPCAWTTAAQTRPRQRGAAFNPRVVFSRTKPEIGQWLMRCES